MFEVWDEEEIIVDQSNDAARLAWKCNVDELPFCAIALDSLKNV